MYSETVINEWVNSPRVLFTQKPYINEWVNSPPKALSLQCLQCLESFILSIIIIWTFCTLSGITTGKSHSLSGTYLMFKTQPLEAHLIRTLAPMTLIFAPKPLDTLWHLWPQENQKCQQRSMIGLLPGVPVLYFYLDG